ncbi:hypothetical protein [Alloscardovia omnicolens]
MVNLVVKASNSTEQFVLRDSAEKYSVDSQMLTAAKTGEAVTFTDASNRDIRLIMRNVTYWYFYG